MVLTLAGSAIGLALALALSRTAASLLYGVSPTDALTFVLVPVFLLLIALAACLVPARRAASLDPILALKYEYRLGVSEADGSAVAVDPVLLVDL